MLLTVFVCYNLINGRGNRHAENKRHDFLDFWHNITNHSLYRHHSYNYHYYSHKANIPFQRKEIL